MTCWWWSHEWTVWQHHWMGWEKWRDRYCMKCGKEQVRAWDG